VLGYVVEAIGPRVVTESVPVGEVGATVSFSWCVREVSEGGSTLVCGGR
jgi:hypothetical protein